MKIFRRRRPAISSITRTSGSGNFPEGTPLTIERHAAMSDAWQDGWPNPPLTSVWIVGESDDHLEAAFTSQHDAEACMAANVAADKSNGLSGAHWWVTEIPLNPTGAPSHNPLRGLGGLGV